MRTLKSSGGAGRDALRPERSKKIVTVAIWHTDRRLKVVGASRMPDGPAPLHSLPDLGLVLKAKDHRRGLLRYAAHARALDGKTTDYKVELLRRPYLVHVAPRFDRNGRIVGTRGTLRLRAGDGGPGRTQEGQEKDLARLLAITRRRHRNSVRAAIRSLELAKSLADTARVNAEIRKERAAVAQEKAHQAQIRAEQEERRARVLVDASAILDESFDQCETLARVGKLLTLRIADWATIHFLEGDRLKRFMGMHRDEGLRSVLDQAFPEEEEAESQGMPGMSRPELFPILTPEDVHALFRKPHHRRRLKGLAVQSMIRTPIRSHGRLIGILMLGSGDPGRLFDLQDLQMARDLASRISLARESSVLYEEAQREISMRKEIESRMRVLNAELERRVSERTRLLEEATREANSFAYTVAHDLRAPLRAITGFCQALREDYSGSLDAMGKDFVDRIVTGARKMDELIRDLLDYARINRADIQRSFVELDQVADDALHQMAPELRERQAEIEVARPLGRALAHGPVLVQVLVNLISNATKFVPPGIRPVVRIRGELRKNRVRLLIQDNGIGIAPEHHDRIFGIFERLNRAEEFPGTGIGLAIVRRAMERLGGAVGVESQSDSGATFWVELPSA